MTYLRYKGYLGTVKPDLENGTLFGRPAFIRDLVTYEAIDLRSLEHEFQISVDSYLESCVELDKIPDKPCKGSFNVRLGPNLHLAANRENISLNDFTRKALAEYIEPHG